MSSWIKCEKEEERRVKIPITFVCNLYIVMTSRWIELDWCFWTALGGLTPAWLWLDSSALWTLCICWGKWLVGLCQCSLLLDSLHRRYWIGVGNVRPPFIKSQSIYYVTGLVSYYVICICILRKFQRIINHYFLMVINYNHCLRIFQFIYFYYIISLC